MCGKGVSSSSLEVGGAKVKRIWISTCALDPPIYALNFKLKPELGTAVIGLDNTTSSSLGLNLTIHRPKSGDQP